MTGLGEMTRAPLLCSEQEAAAPAWLDEPEHGREGQVGDAKCSQGKATATGLPAEDSTGLRHRPPRQPLLLVTFHKEPKSYKVNACKHFSQPWSSQQALETR